MKKSKLTLNRTTIQVIRNLRQVVGGGTKWDNSEGRACSNSCDTCIATQCGAACATVFGPGCAV